MVDDSSAARVGADLRARCSRLAPGTRLPSTRELAAHHGVGPVTVQAALRQLVAEGLIETRPGAGTFTAAPVTANAADRSWQTAALGAPRVETASLEGLVEPRSADLLVLSTGYLPLELQATDVLRAAGQRVLRRPGPWDTVPLNGLADLRAWFATQLGGGVTANDVVVTPGGQAALATAFRALAGPGDAVIVESPTYLGALAAARSAGLTLVPWPSGPDGPDADVLDTLLTSSRARLIYAQPTYANPTGATWSAPRRHDVLHVVARHGAFLIEDDWAHDIALDGPTPPSLAQHDSAGHVIAIRSLTKAAAPGLRIGAVAARGAAARRLRSARVVEDLFVSGYLQRVTFELLTHTGWPTHVRRLGRVLRARRDALVEAVVTELGPSALTGVPHGGFHLWVRLPDGIDDETFTAQALASGIVVSSGRPWFPAEPTGPHLRLSFTALEPADAKRAVQRLAAVLPTSAAASRSTRSRRAVS